MLSRSSLRALALSAGLSLLASAHAATMDFDGLDMSLAGTSPILGLGSVYQEDGFSLTTRGGVSFNMSGGRMFAVTPNSPYWTGTPGLFSDIGSAAYGSAFLLTKDDGGLFDLVSMDAASFWTVASGRYFSVYGRTSSNTTVVKSLYLDTSVNTLETITFGAEFSNLTSVIFSSVYAQVDNINLRYAGEPMPAVPEADALWMSLAGLAVLGPVLTRRRTAA
ncbi:hypothetical protein WNB94_16190 [Aquabacterium sp. A3]|uniref:hypothetical protein n=1 Tax=Aquabacterium sp. A3 TaxID=3132829 RepID=UPI003119C8AA